MSDILDTLDDLEDENVDEETEADVENSGDDADSSSAEGEVQERGDDEFSESRARDITEAIKSVATATYGLLHQAYKHKAHKALGYSSWEKYVQEEFEMSKSRSYQLITQAETIEAIKEITPEGTEIKLSEAEIRDIKSELPRLQETIKSETSDMDKEEAEDFINDLIQREREQAQADKKALDAKKKAEQDAQQEGYQNALEDAADGMLADGGGDPNGGKAYEEGGVVMEPDAPNDFSADADSGFYEEEVEGNAGAMSSEDALNLYSFFSMLSMVTSLPDADYLVDLISEDRRDEVDNQIAEAASWINRFNTIWTSKYG